MPNTPASIGRGITVAVGNAHVTPARRNTCDALLRAVGEVAWVDDEGLLDAVTAVSGSGPAYVFYLAECLAEAGIKAGLAGDLAHKLARWTVAGAGELLHRSELRPDVLRQNVTSPGGTTRRRRPCWPMLMAARAERACLSPEDSTAEPLGCSMLTTPRPDLRRPSRPWPGIAR